MHPSITLTELAALCLLLQQSSALSLLSLGWSPPVWLSVGVGAGHSLVSTAQSVPGCHLV